MVENNFAFERLGGFSRVNNISNDRSSTPGGPEGSRPSDVFINKIQEKGFAAIIDSTGEGDFETIQEALLSGAKNIFVRAGTYPDNVVITTDLGFDPNNIVIEGEGTNSIITGKLTCFGEPLRNIVLSNLHFKNNTSEILFLTNSKFINCIFTNFNLVIQDESELIIIKNNSFINCSVGINTSFANGDMIIKNNYFDRCDTGILLGKTFGEVNHMLLSTNSFNTCKDAIIGGKVNKSIFAGNQVFWDDTDFSNFQDVGIDTTGGDKNIVMRNMVINGELIGVTVGNITIVDSNIILEWDINLSVGTGVNVNNIIT